MNAYSARGFSISTMRFVAELVFVVASVIRPSIQRSGNDEACHSRDSNPFVTMLAHPTGRLLVETRRFTPRHSGVLEAAAETGTWIELKMPLPQRLDLDCAGPLAKEKGVRL